jgi:hypothetical protein
MLATVLGLSLLQEWEGEGAGAGAGLLGGAIGCVLMVFYLALIVAIIAGLWKVFTKAGKPGWAAIVPIYNIIVLLEIVGKPLWWIVLFIIPLVNIVAAILVNVALAEKFGKGIGFAVGLILLPIVFIPILGFGDATYRA